MGFWAAFVESDLPNLILHSFENLILESYPARCPDPWKLNIKLNDEKTETTRNTNGHSSVRGFSSISFCMKQKENEQRFFFFFTASPSSSSEGRFLRRFENVLPKGNLILFNGQVGLPTEVEGTLLLEWRTPAWVISSQVYVRLCVSLVPFNLPFEGERLYSLSLCSINVNVFRVLQIQYRNREFSTRFRIKNFHIVFQSDSLRSSY